MRKLVSLLIFAFISMAALATHNRAGEITYTHISGFTYEVVITTCTKSSVIADRQWLNINWGDLPTGGTLDSLERESISPVPDADAQINIYRGTHTYSGPGQYLIQMADPNRNEGVHNIPNSVEEEFCVQTLLIINPQAGHNNSVQLLNPAKEEACLARVWQHNPGAYDPDGDILTYSLITPLGRDLDEDGWNDPVPGYELPDDYTESPDDIFFIDPNDGTVTWDVTSWPPGEYNIAILIEEWREVAGQLVKVGHVIRDMQILVEQCPNNPPIIEEVLDTCVEAFTNLTLQIAASDIDGDPIDLEAFGGPLTEVENQAFFTDNNDDTGVFSWTPECEEVRLNPYQVTFKATDFSTTVDLSDFMTVNITVVAPAVENPTVEPDGNSFVLNWDPNICIDHLTDLQVSQSVYKIYRRQGSYGFEPDFCETGVPDYTGFELIDTVEGLENTNYIDTEGVFFGGEFCYMIVTCFPDGAESYASEEFCASIIKEVPVMTNADVNVTDATNGEIYVAWSPATQLDQENFPGPYYYELLHGEGYGGANDVIFTSTPNANLFNEDTTFVHTGIDTETTAHTYRVNLFSGEDFVGSAFQASSLYLELESGDETITLFVNDLTPWTNTQYEIYRLDPGETDFALIATVDEPIYEDIGLPNNVEICYYVQSIGAYTVPESGTIDPILNKSQEACGFAVDLTPPCPPELSIEPDCELEQAFLTWTNPNESCELTDDTELYNLYYAPTTDQDLEFVVTLTGAELTEYIWNEEGDLNSIAGCYAVTALDSLTPDLNGDIRRNESEFSNVVCIDNCPLYFLPNVFSPNNDGSNDVFTAFPFKFVESVEFFVFNRWGIQVFETRDPLVSWDGTDQETGEICADGTYYYTARVNTIRLEGIVVEELSGTITLLDGLNPVKE
ncbi:MAG: gliding motility-associated C-terminal domain-containing protein [Flavobacteriales bacterium]|nr:gliding motility-associated C-terminal domain-containing protein [Flavobacteriales bacterium]